MKGMNAHQKLFMARQMAAVHKLKNTVPEYSTSPTLSLDIHKYFALVWCTQKTHVKSI